MEREETESDKPTVTIHRDALLGLLDQSVAVPAPRPPRAHTVSREELRSRAVTRNEATTTEMPALEHPVEPLDTDLTPALSPHLVAAVIVLLLIVFLAAVHSH